MKISSKFILVSTVSFILMLISISTPAWSVFLVRGTWSRAEILEILEDHSDEDDSSSSDESDEEGEVKVNGGNIKNVTTEVKAVLSSSETDIETSTNDIKLIKLESKHHHTSVVRNRYHGVYIHHGIWYSIVCDVLTFDGKDDWKSCKYDTNKDDYQRFNSFVPAGGSQKYFQATNQFMVLQFQIETTLSLVSLVIAMTTLVSYQRGYLQRRIFGYLCCFFFFLSGTLFWIAVGKSFKLIAETVTALGKISNKVQFEVEAPWSPIIGGIGATMVAGVALSLLMVTSGKYTEGLVKTSKNKRKIYSVLKPKPKQDAEKELIAQPTISLEVETQKMKNSQ